MTVHHWSMLNDGRLSPYGLGVLQRVNLEVLVSAKTAKLMFGTPRSQIAEVLFRGHLEAMEAKDRINYLQMLLAEAVAARLTASSGVNG